MPELASSHPSITVAALLMGYLRDRLGSDALYDLIGNTRGFPITDEEKASVQAARARD